MATHLLVGVKIVIIMIVWKYEKSNIFSLDWVAS
jgi:hypothetical protein